MQVTANSRDISSALKIAQMAIQKRYTIPILGCVIIKADGPRLSLEGTSLDVWIKTDCDVISGDDDFAVAVPAKMLAAALKHAGNGQVTMTVDDTHLRISIDDGASTFAIDRLPVGDWPEAPVGAPSLYETFTNGHLKSMLDAVSFSISTEETRYYLNGIFWEPGAFVATNGHHLTKYAYSATSDMPGFNGIIPRDTVSIIRKLATGNVRTSIIDVAPDKTMLEFEFGCTRVLTKLINGTFPDYRRVIPSGDGDSFVFDGERLRDAALRIVAFQKAHGGALRAVAFTKGEDGNVQLSSSLGSSIATANTFAPWPDMCANDRFGFNAEYLIGVAKPGAVSFNIEAPDKPAIITYAGEDDMFRVMMPMRV